MVTLAPPPAITRSSVHQPVQRPLPGSSCWSVAPPSFTTTVRAVPLVVSLTVYVPAVGKRMSLFAQPGL